MKLRTTLAGTAVLVTLLGAGVLPAGPIATPAQAATSISINVFYDDLAQYGDWVSINNRYVFVPSGIAADWRPYTVGHWVYAERVGWTWVSDEPFGWATFHYGRWGYDDDIGWYWVPGTVWAPAWVSWRRTHDHVVWAPLPVREDYDYDDADVRVDVNIGDIPDYYWVAVPAPRFLEINLNVVIIDDDRDRLRIVREAEPLGSVRIVNNIVVNNVVNVDFIKEETGREVKQVKLREANDPRDAKSTDDEVVAVPERIGRDENAKPSKLSDLEQVKEKAPERKVDQGEPDVEQDSATEVQEGSQQQQQGTVTGSEPEQGTAAGTEQGQANKRKQKQAEQPGSETAPGQGVIDEQDKAEQGQAEEKVQTKRKKRKANQAETQGAVEPGQASAQQNGQKAKRKKQKTKGAIDQDVAPQDQATDEQSRQKVKRKKPQTQGVIDQGDVQQGQSKPKRKKPQPSSETQGMLDQQGQDGDAAMPAQEQPAQDLDSGDQQAKPKAETRKKKPVEEVQP